MYSMLITAPLGSALAHFCKFDFHLEISRIFPVVSVAILASWIVVAATASPFSSSQFAAVCVLLSFPITKFIISYAKTTELLHIRQEYEEGELLRAISRNSAFSMQFGACVGSVLFFLLTTVTHVISAD